MDEIPSLSLSSSETEILALVQVRKSDPEMEWLRFLRRNSSFVFGISQLEGSRNYIGATTNPSPYSARKFLVVSPGVTICYAHDLAEIASKCIRPPPPESGAIPVDYISLFDKTRSYTATNFKVYTDVIFNMANFMCVRDLLQLCCSKCRKRFDAEVRFHFIEGTTAFCHIAEFEYQKNLLYEVMGRKWGPHSSYHQLITGDTLDMRGGYAKLYDLSPPPSIKESDYDLNELFAARESVMSNLATILANSRGNAQIFSISGRCNFAHIKKNGGMYVAQRLQTLLLTYAASALKFSPHTLTEPVHALEKPENNTDLSPFVIFIDNFPPPHYAMFQTIILLRTRTTPGAHVKEAQRKLFCLLDRSNIDCSFYDVYL